MKGRTFVPLAGARSVLLLVMHTCCDAILIYQIFKRKNKIWLAAAIGLELLVTGVIIGFAEAGLSYGWVTAVSILFMGVNLLILYKLDAFAFDKDQDKIIDLPIEDQQAQEIEE